jgi:hypothetical protein
MIASLAVIEGDTTSLDSKVTACNTGAVVVSSSALPTGAATESSLASVDGKITSCDTGAVVVSSSALPSGAATSALQTTGNSSLSSIDGKITACDTGAVVVSSSALPSGAATSALQTTGNSSLSSIDGKIVACDTGAVVVSSSALPSGAATEASLTAPQYQDGDTIAVADKGILVMGRNGTNSAKPIHITSNGDVEVEIADFVKGQAASSASFPVVLASDQTTLGVKQADVVNVGSQGNIINNSSLAPGNSTSVLDISDVNNATILYEDTSTGSSDGLDVEVSLDNSTFYGVGSIYPSVVGSKRIGYLTSFAVHGLLYLRLTNISSTDTYANVIASLGGSA